jgi:UDP-N-acetylmuramyl pentapeptide phosphotransferase/UDP-N-acetylglucosamine-1-phosphate transferase
MEIWLIIDLLSLVFVILMTAMMTPQILHISYRKNLFDEPDSRKVHKTPIPRLGGFTFFPSITFAVLMIFGIGLATNADWLVNAVTPVSVAESVFLGCSLILLYIVGFVDDLIGVKYSFKFAFQIAASLLLVSGGLIINNLHGLFGIYEINNIIAVPLTLVVVILIINAMNFIDGIDGLSSGLSMLACLIYGAFALLNGAYIFSLLAFCTFGALTLFFCYNVFGNVDKHRKIFMGDTGTMTIGIILTALSFRICKMESIDYNFNYGAVAFAPLLIPCLDVVRVYFHRLRKGKNPFLPDRNHIHHKLLSIGFSARQTMIVILIFSALISLANILLSQYIGLTWLIIADVLVWTLYNVYLTHKIESVRRSKAIA